MRFQTMVRGVLTVAMALATVTAARAGGIDTDKIYDAWLTGMGGTPEQTKENDPWTPEAVERTIAEDRKAAARIRQVVAQVDRGEVFLTKSESGQISMVTRDERENFLAVSRRMAEGTEDQLEKARAVWALETESCKQQLLEELADIKERIRRLQGGLGDGEAVEKDAPEAGLVDGDGTYHEAQ